ncbi:DUF6948 domain-containing protein [Petrachloros mirabilis]
MDINSLTIGQARELASIFGNSQHSTSLNKMLGEKVIVRTYSAGVWFGLLSEKSGAEVILTHARRMWLWKATEGISLSACAMHGIDASKSKIVGAVPSVWLEAIEIIPCTPLAIARIEGAPNAKAQ